MKKITLIILTSFLISSFFHQLNAQPPQQSTSQSSGTNKIGALKTIEIRLNIDLASPDASIKFVRDSVSADITVRTVSGKVYSVAKSRSLGALISLSTGILDTDFENSTLQVTFNFPTNSTNPNTFSFNYLVKLNYDIPMPSYGAGPASQPVLATVKTYKSIKLMDMSISKLNNKTSSILSDFQ